MNQKGTKKEQARCGLCPCFSSSYGAPGCRLSVCCLYLSRGLYLLSLVLLCPCPLWPRNDRAIRSPSAQRGPWCPPHNTRNDGREKDRGALPRLLSLPKYAAYLFMCCRFAYQFNAGLMAPAGPLCMYVCTNTPLTLFPGLIRSPSARYDTHEYAVMIYTLLLSALSGLCCGLSSSLAQSPLPTHMGGKGRKRRRGQGSNPEPLTNAKHAKR